MDDVGAAVAHARGRYDWNDLRTFFVVGKTGSFNQAAAALGCKQQTVSLAVARLEGALGAKLLDRNHTGAQLTHTGRQVFERAQAIYRINSEIESSYTDYDSQPTGEVTVRCSEGLATGVIAPHLADFYSANPDIDMVVRELDRPLGVHDAPDDVAVRFDRGQSSDVAVIPLGTMHFMLFATRKFVSKYGLPSSMADTVNFRILTLTSYRHQRDSWKRANQHMDSYVREVARYGLVADSSAMAHAAFLNGAGLLMVPTFAVRKEALFGFEEEEVILLDYGVHQAIDFWLVHHIDRGEITRVRKVVDFLKKAFKQPCFERELVHPSEFSNVQVVRPRR